MVLSGYVLLSMRFFELLVQFFAPFLLYLFFVFFFYIWFSQSFGLFVLTILLFFLRPFELTVHCCFRSSFAKLHVLQLVFALV